MDAIEIKTESMSHPNGPEIQRTTSLQRFLSSNDRPPPMKLEFENIKAQVFQKNLQTKTNKELKTILTDVQGSVQSGERKLALSFAPFLQPKKLKCTCVTVLALMGPSGAGKSSLLNIIGGRFEGKYTGEILVNGAPKNKQLKKHIGYVLQNDVMVSFFIGCTTVTSIYANIAP